jgi:hypothetical protein
VTTVLYPKQIVLNDKLLLRQVISGEAIVRVTSSEGIFTKETFLEMVGVANLETAKMV